MVEPGTIGPSNPRRPKFRRHPADRSARAHILHEANGSAGLYDPAKLSQCRHLEIVREHAKQKHGHGRIETARREIQSGYVHLPQLDSSSGRNLKSALGPRQHGWTMD
jgi:hypothetical protein